MMTGKLIDGVAIGKEIREEIKERVTVLKEQGCNRALLSFLSGIIKLPIHMLEIKKSRVLK